MTTIIQVSASQSVLLPSDFVVLGITRGYYTKVHIMCPTGTEGDPKVRVSFHEFISHLSESVTLTLPEKANFLGVLDWCEGSVSSYIFYTKEKA